MISWHKDNSFLFHLFIFHYLGFAFILIAVIIFILLYNISFFYLLFFFFIPQQCKYLTRVSYVMMSENHEKIRSNMLNCGSYREYSEDNFVFPVRLREVKK